MNKIFICLLLLCQFCLANAGKDSVFVSRQETDSSEIYTLYLKTNNSLQKIYEINTEDESSINYRYHYKDNAIDYDCISWYNGSGESRQYIFFDRQTKIFYITKDYSPEFSIKKQSVDFKNRKLIIYNDENIKDTTIEDFFYFDSYILYWTFSRDCGEGSYPPYTLSVQPFDLRKCMEWRTWIYDSGVRRIGLSDNKNLKQLVDSTYPRYFNEYYYMLKSNKADCSIYIVVSKEGREETNLHFNLLNVNHGKIIASLPLGFLLDNLYNSFVISEDLKITTFKENVFYNEKRNKIFSDVKTGEYQIQKDCKIVKLK